MAEVLGRGQVREPWLTTVVTCGGFLRLGGSEQQQAQYLPAIIDGSSQWACAFAEGNSSCDLLELQTSAQSKADGFVVNGDKIAVINGDCADQIIVSARTEDGFSLFIIGAGLAGVQREKFIALDGSCGANIRLDNVALPAESLLGVLDQGLTLMEQVIDQALDGLVEVVR